MTVNDHRDHKNIKLTQVVFQSLKQEFLYILNEALVDVFLFEIRKTIALLRLLFHLVFNRDELSGQ